MYDDFYCVLSLSMFAVFTAAFDSLLLWGVLIGFVAAKLQIYVTRLNMTTLYEWKCLQDIQNTWKYL